MGVGYLSVAIQHYGKGQHRRAISQVLSYVQRFHATNQQNVIYAHFICIISYFKYIIYRDANKLNAVPNMFVL